MNRQDIIKLIKESNGKDLTISFIKRSTREIRVMSCKVGVVADELTGNGPKYSYDYHKLISVYDTQAKQYKSLPVEGIISVMIDGKEYKVTGE